jgi:hypothetical protein
MIDAQRLCLAVLEQALIDLTNANKRYFTELWFTSDNHAPVHFCGSAIISTLIPHAFGAGCLNSSTRRQAPRVSFDGRFTVHWFGGPDRRNKRLPQSPQD